MKTSAPVPVKTVARPAASGAAIDAVVDEAVEVAVALVAAGSVVGHDGVVSSAASRVRASWGWMPVPVSGEAGAAMRLPSIA